MNDSTDDESIGPSDVTPPLESGVDCLAGGRFRPRDSMGALQPTQAQIDAAFARGYAQGQEEAQADALDLLRTILAGMVERRFGSLEVHHLDWIERAQQKSLARAIAGAHSLESLDDLLTL